MALSKFYKMITPASPTTPVGDNQDLSGVGGLYGNYAWYHRIIAGSSSRITRYREYDLMDNDIDVNVCLDLMAEEITGNNIKGELPLKLEIVTGQEQYVAPRVVVTLNAALRTWCTIHDWHSKLFSIARNTIKYGDTFFLKPKHKQKSFIYVNTKNVLGAIVREDDITDVRGWQIRMDSNAVNGPAGSYGTGGDSTIGDGIVEYDIKDIIRFSLYQETDEEAPFGKSVLHPIYKTFKQKELLEDAILIYRIQRAPEKRAFYIDVGNMHPGQRAKHMESIKAEIKQKKIPSYGGGASQIESVYNPMSQQEDFWFPMRADGSGSRVEVLPAGQNLGSLEDLMYFYNKIFRGLRIPRSFVDPTSEGGGVANDGKVGIAYIQEVKFSLYMERLQRCLEKTFDKEFKDFIKLNGINVDTTIFKITLPPPSNYEASRKQMMDADLLANYSTVSGIQEISKRFGLVKYGQWTEADLKMNERLLRQEKGLNPDGDDRDLPKLYNPEQAELGGFEGGFGGGGGSFAGGGGDIPDLDGGDDGTGEGGETGVTGEGGLPELGGNVGGKPNAPANANQKGAPQNSKPAAGKTK
jgi:uncharacterized membrane protein YgcG